MLRARTKLFVGIGLVLAMSTWAASGLSQSGDDPRNTSEDYYDAIDGALCMAHHALEGFRPVDVRIVERYSQLPIGEVVDLQVRLRDPWDHQIHDIAVTLNTSLAPNIEVITGDRQPNLENLGQLIVLPGTGADQGFEFLLPVLENASRVLVRATLTDAGVAGTLGRDPTLHMVLSGRTDTQVSGRDQVTIEWNKDTISQKGLGEYDGRLWVTGELDQEYTLTLDYFVHYNATSATEFTFYAGDSVTLRSQGESFTMTIPIIIHGPEEGTLDISAFVRTHFDHPAGTNAADDGHFYRFTTMRVRGGDQLIQAQGVNAPIIVGPTVDVMNLFARIVGFVTLILVPVAMVTGGMFGKVSRRWLNKATGGAKKRVLWHSTMSWIILVVASLHFLLSLLEQLFTWDKGLFWGGVGWALMMTLGVTGYWQVRMIKRWNYKTWRNLHLGAAIGVLAFGLMHTLLDGSDLTPVREAMPWVNNLIWP